MAIRSTFAGLEIAKTGLFISQKGLDVTGHNVANVDTVGYTRQRLLTTAYEPYSAVASFRPVDNALVGGGTRVTTLNQIRDSFLDRQYRTEASSLSKWTTRTQGLTYVEALFEGADLTGLSDSIDALFEGFNSVATEPNDGAQRVALQQAGIILSESLNQMYERLLDQQKDQNLAVKTVVQSINNIAEQITVLNKAIMSYEIEGDPANDLRDKRNLLLDQLSGLVDIEYGTDSGTSQFWVKIGGETLLNHLSFNEIKLGIDTDPTTGIEVYVPQWASGNEVKITDGELRAHMDLRDNAGSDNSGIPYYIEQLNTLARAIVSAVNDIHSSGWSHSNGTNGSQTGINFFNVPLDEEGNEDITKVTAGNIWISQDIIDNHFNIAASSEKVDPDTLPVGNNEIAKKLFGLINSQSLEFNGEKIGSFQGFLDGVVLDLSITLNRSKVMQDTQETQVLSVDNSRASVSGVSLDEEMTNLIKYQHAYSGASRVITAMDEAIELIINRMGKVGL